MQQVIIILILMLRVNISLKLLQTKVYITRNKFCHLLYYIYNNNKNQIYNNNIIIFIKLFLSIYIEKNYTFGFLHIKAVDDSSHDNKPELKVNIK